MVPLISSPPKPVIILFYISYIFFFMLCSFGDFGSLPRFSIRYYSPFCRTNFTCGITQSGNELKLDAPPVPTVYRRQQPTTTSSSNTKVNSFHSQNGTFNVQSKQINIHLFFCHCRHNEVIHKKQLISTANNLQHNNNKKKM